ncbi:hypothetical protein SDC9_66072 [bioreactor metagenome]|uniref:Uncharacterized protein n=1 Tax=bioreactor metagenome TaxID=1076179 RepID=A0A644XTU8_9ZZZZ
MDCAAVLETIAVIAGSKNMAVVGQTVQQGRGHLGITKHVCPFAKAQIRGDHLTGALVKRREQMEEQRSTRRAEGQIAELIEYCHGPIQMDTSLRRPQARGVMNHDNTTRP